MQVYIWNAIIGVILAGILCFGLGYTLGKDKGLEEGYDASSSNWSKTCDNLIKEFEKRMDIYKNVMLDEKNRYHALCEKYPYNDSDMDDCSGLLTNDEEE